ncbi:MAG: chromate transporter [Spirochaetia bacterium]|nr:chromate transporter [Spirochaetia bacterium]
MNSLHEFFLLCILFIKISLAGFGGIFTIWALSEESLVKQEAQIKNQSISHKSNISENSNTKLFNETFNSLKVSEDQFKRIFSISQLLPGPAASGISMLGFQQGGILYMTAIFIGLTLPGIFLMPLLMLWNRKMKDHPRMTAFKTGASLAVIAVLFLFEINLLASDVERFISGNIKSLIFPAIAGIVFYLSLKKKTNPLVLVLSSALIGGFLL